MILFWAGILASTILAYITLDGFDLGVGILFGFTNDEHFRRKMLATIAPVWDGNQTWLVITGAVLFGAFPVAYSALLSAFYLPLIVMLGGLILRGVSFEYRYKATTSRAFWDTAFWVGSITATFTQGLTIGAIVDGIPMDGTHFAGGTLFWMHLFPLVCGCGLCVGYALLGAGWLLLKTDGSLSTWLYRVMPWFIGVAVLFFVIAFVHSARHHLQVMQSWRREPFLAIFPVIGIIAGVALVVAVKKQIRTIPFPMAAIVFACAFLVLAVSFWPFMIPYSLTIDQAASPLSSLKFMFWGGGLVVLPLTVIYTITAYRVFSGVNAPE